jgi:predicted alpha/beta-hydrolase family hydrolase
VTSGASNTIAGVVLFPGAGSSASHASLVSLEEALSPLPVARIDFPYRRAGKSFPDKTPVLVECVRSEVRAFAEQLSVSTSQLLIGGRSMGGRMCSMAVADETDPLDVAALVLMSYPLHPPKKPENLRTEHLPRINVLTLCISGTKDNFGSPEELESAFSVVPAAVQWHWVHNGRHELAKADAEIAATVLQFIQTV